MDTFEPGTYELDAVCNGGSPGAGAYIVAAGWTVEIYELEN